MDEQDNAAAQPPQANGGGQAPQLTASQVLDAQLDQYFFPIANVLIRGALTSLPNVPPERSMAALCRAIGRNLSLTFSMGDLVAILKMRKLFKEQFEGGVNIAKPQPAPPQPPSQTATPPDARR